MLSYRVDGNIRLDAAISRVLQVVYKSSRVLDIGCGAGIITEAIGRKASRGSVLGIDISDRNIWYCNRTIQLKNVRFEVADVVTDFAHVASMIDGKIDVVALVDVIEHLPVVDRVGLFENLRVVASENCVVVLTYPSPQYQSYLMTHQPNELQMIDNIIELSDLCGEAARSGFSLKHYSLENVWRRNQYVHCIFQVSHGLGERANPTPNAKALGALVSAPKRLIRKWRQWKYVNRIFGVDR
jgi:SAM-dependent methyltransferase